MANIEMLKKMLIFDEGKKKKAYKDSEGIWTIGVGRNIEDPGLSDQEIDFLLENDIQRRLVHPQMQDLLKDIDDTRQSVLIDMSFMGIRKLMGFKNMIAAIKDGDFNEAAKEMLSSSKYPGEPSLWSTQVGPRATRLAYMMKTGKIHEDYN